MNYKHTLVWTLGWPICLLAAGCAVQSADQSRATQEYVSALNALHANDKTRATSLLERAIDQNPDLVMAHIVLGDLYFDENETAKAASQYEVLTRLDPYNADNFYKLGLSEQLLNRLKSAAASYLRALDLNPADARAARNLGLVYLALNQPRDAAHYLQLSTTLDPNNADGYANYGVALDALGQYAKAESAYRNALELGAPASVTLLNLGYNLMLQHRPDDAVDVLKEAVGKSGTPVAHLRLGEALAMAHQDQAAMAQFNAALKLDPTFYPAMNSAAQTLIQQYEAGLQLDDAKRNAAVTFWRNSLKVHADQPEVQTQLQRWNHGASITR